MSYGYDSPRRPAPPRPQRGPAALLLLLGALCVLLGVLIIRNYWPFGGRDGTDPDATLRVVTPRGKLWDVEQSITTLAAKASKSVVHIHSLGQRSAGTGSGFVWD